MLFRILFGKLFEYLVVMKQNLLILIFCFFYSYSIFGQDTKAYKGGYTFNKLRGIGEFNYYLEEGDKPILDGVFRFEYKDLDSVGYTEFLKLEVVGNYESYKKDKSWTYRLAAHQMNIKDIQNRQIIADLDTRLIDLDAQYEEGKLQGNWKYLERQWLEGQYSDFFKAENLVFSKDKLTGTVRFESFDQKNPYQIFGQVDSEGLLIGNWDFFYTSDQIPIHETRRYESGFLIGLSKVNNLTTEKIDEVVFYNAIEKLDSLNQGFDVDYSVSEEFFGLTFNDGFTEESEEFQGQYRGTFLLEDALSRILQFEEDNFVKEDRLIKSPIATRRFAYEISSQDQKRYQEAIEIFDYLQNEVKQQNRRDFLTLNQNTSDSLSFSKAYFEYLSQKVRKFERVIDLLKNENIRFVNPSSYSREGLDFLKQKESIEYSFKGELKVEELDFSSVEKSNKLGEDLLNYLKKEKEYFSEIEDYVIRQQQEFRQEKDLVAIESRIISEKALVDSLKVSIAAQNERHRSLLDSFYENLAVDQYQALLDEYNQTEDFLEKAYTGDELIEMLQFVRRRLPELGKYAGMATEIERDFTEKTLDPFTFETEFEVLRQPILVKSAQKIINHELEEIKAEKDYEVVRARLLTLDALRNRLSELKGRNTKRLERNLNQSGLGINQLKKLLSL